MWNALQTRLWWNGRHTGLRNRRPSGMRVQISPSAPSISRNRPFQIVSYAEPGAACRPDYCRNLTNETQVMQ